MGKVTCFSRPLHTQIKAATFFHSIVTPFSEMLSDNKNLIKVMPYMYRFFYMFRIISMKGISFGAITDVSKFVFNNLVLQFIFSDSDKTFETETEGSKILGEDNIWCQRSFYHLMKLHKMMLWCLKYFHHLMKMMLWCHIPVCHLV